MVRRTGKGLKIDREAAIHALGLDRIIDTVGTKQLLETIGPKRLIDEIGLDWFLANLSPADRRELKRRLK
jgi:hypothetical protein